MKAAVKLVLLLCVALGLFGCATVQLPTKEALGKIKTIVIVAPPAIPEYSVNIVYHPADVLVGGLIGALIRDAELTPKTTQFNASITGQHFDGARTITEALKNELEARGYAVIVSNPLRADRKLLSTYGSVPANGDAYLDLIVDAGYWAESHDKPYYPSVTASVQLVEARSQSTIYKNTMIVGPYLQPGSGVRSVSIDPTHGVDDFAALKSSPSRSVNGLRAAMQAVAKQIASDL